MFGKLYAVVGAGMLGFYGLTAFNGWEYGAPHRAVVPAAERQPGWSRRVTHHYWYTGYRGGK